MYAFLGYGGCRAVFEMPQVDEETLDSLISFSSETAKEAYEEKYRIVGNVQVAYEFFKSIRRIGSWWEKGNERICKSCSIYK